MSQSVNFCTPRLGNRSPIPAVSWNRLPSLLALTITVFVASLSSSAGAIEPPTNPLRLFTTYDVSWVNPVTGQFGVNLTFFRPASMALSPGWGMLMSFRSNNAVVQSFTDRSQFTMASDGKGNIMANCRQEQEPPNITSDLAASDAAKGLRRMAVYINAKMQASANLADLTPIAFTLMAPNDPSTMFRLVDQRDFTRLAVRKNLPQQPFGPFLGISLASAQEASAPAGPDGTTLVATTGLFVYLAIFFVTGVVFILGALDKHRAANEYRMASSEGGLC